MKWFIYFIVLITGSLILSFIETLFGINHPILIGFVWGFGTMLYFANKYIFVCKKN